MLLRNCGCVLASLLIATSALAQNLVVNPDFTTDIVGWSGSGSSWDGSDGDPAPGSLRLTVADSDVISACIPVVGEQKVRLVMNARALHSNQLARATAKAVAFTDAACSSAATLAGTVESYGMPDDGWYPFDHSFVLPGATQSVHIVLSASPAPGYTETNAHFDGIAFGPASNLIVHHGFESCWSPALTTAGMADLLNSRAEGAKGCIPAYSGTCSTSMCNGVPGCPVTLRAGSIAYSGTNQLVSRFDATGGVDPLVIDIKSPINNNATCTITVTNTSNLIATYQDFFTVTNDGNNGWYMEPPYNAGNSVVSGLSASDWTVDGDVFSCKAGAYFSTSQIESAIAAGVQAIASDVAGTALGNTICPLP